VFSYMEIVDGETVYILSDANREIDSSTASSWEVVNTNLAGGKHSTEGAKKKAWSLSWADLLHDTADDGGVGADTLEGLAEAEGKTYTLRVYYAAGSYDSYTVRIKSFSRKLVRASRRERYSVSMSLEEM